MQQQENTIENSLPAVRRLSFEKNHYNLQKGINSSERVDRKFQILRNKLMPVFN